MVEKLVGGILVLELYGPVTLGPETETFRRKIRELIAKGHLKIVLDLADVNYIDSVGQSSLVEALTTVRAHGGELKLLNLTKRIRDVLQLSRLMTMFDIHESLEAACRSFDRSVASATGHEPEPPSPSGQAPTPREPIDK